MTNRLSSPSAVSSWSRRPGWAVDERVEQLADRRPGHLDLLRPADVARRTGGIRTALTQARRRRAGRAQGRRARTAPSPTPATASGRPAARAATAASEQTGQAGSRRSSQLGERGVEGVEQQQPAGERVADPEQELERLVRLEQAHDPGHDAEDAGHRAAGRELGRRRGRVEAAVARPVERLEDRQLALEPEDAGVDDRDARGHRRVVEQCSASRTCRSRRG